MKKLLLLFAVLFLWTQSSWAQLSGVKTIPGDYASIEAAVTDLNVQGVGAGGVTFNVAAGHTESITAPILLTATGTVANPIVFQKSGAGDNPVITRTDAGTLIPTTLGAQGDAVFIIQGGDYITIDAINILTNDAGIEYGYYLRKASVTDGSKNVTIKNCLIDLTKGVSAYVAGIYSSNNDELSLVTSASGITVTSEGGRHENVSILGNTVRDVHVGVLLRGFNHTASPYNFFDQNFVIGSVGQGNVINNFGGGIASSSYGIYMIYHNGIDVSYNTLNNTAAGGTAFLGATSYGIFTSGALNANVSITNNSLTLTGGGTTTLLHAINNAAGGTGAGNTVNINNNTVTGCDYPTASSAPFSAIVNTASAATININNNTVTNNSLTGTGAFTGIDGGGNTTQLSVLTISGNTVNNNTKSGASGSMFLTRGSANTVHYFNNTVYTNGFTASSGTSSCIIYGYYNAGSPPTENVYNNQIYDLTVAGTNTGTSSILYGITTSSVVAATKSIYGNEIYNLSAQSGDVRGISQSLGSNVQIYRNEIYNLSNATLVTTAGRVSGIVLASGTCYVYNNFISELYAPACAAIDAVRGISSTSTTASTTIGLYYNTVYLDAASTGVDFGSSGIFHTFNTTSTTASLDMRNNIVVNKSTPNGTGSTVAFRRSATTNLNNYGSGSNNNAFYAGTPGANNLIYNDGTNSDQTMLDFQNRVAPRESVSFSEDVDFVNVAVSPYDLRLDLTTSTQCESGGQQISTPVAITTDYFATIRALETGYLGTGTAPDLGAYEAQMTGLDLSPPLIVYTALTNTASTAARNLMVTVTDASGVPVITPGWPNLYWRINAGSWNAATPTGVVGDDYTYSFGGGVVSGDVVEYYVVAQDNASTPNVGAFPSAGADNFSINPPAASTPPTIPSSYTIVAGIGGALTVGTGGTYPSLTGVGGLFADINTKVVTSNITVTILTDITEDGTNALNQWNEDAPGNFTVTIQPSEAVNKTISGSFAGGLIRLNGADRVTFDGRFGGSGNYLTIQNTSTATNTAAIQLLSLGAGVGATDNTIRNCNIAAGSNTVTSTFGIFVGGATVSTSGTGADNNNLNLESNNIYKAYFGIYARGVATSGELTGLSISNNTIGSDTDTDYVTGYGIYSAGINGATFSGNEIYNMIYNGSKYGMYFATNVSNSVFSRNSIHGFNQTNTTTSYYAIGIYFSSGSVVSNNQLDNNIIYDLNVYGSTSNFYYAGIRIAGGTGFKLYYNSINMSGAFGSAVSGCFAQCLFVSTLSTNMVLVNNIFSNTRTGTSPKAYTVHAVTGTTFATINYNDYYSTGAAIGFFGAEVIDFAAWQTATTQDANSISADPQFLSETNLQPFTGSPVLAAGTLVAGITTDYTGAVRSGTTPSMGAYEGGVVPNSVGWCNLQWPATANIGEGETFTAYAQVWKDGVTNSPGQGAGIESWFGWSATNTDPATWTNWIAGSYNTDNGNNDEYMAAIGAGIATGTYYYASRFRITGGSYQYGGYSGGGGGFWDGVTYVSGVLTVNTVFPWEEDFQSGTFPPVNWTRSKGLLASPTVLTGTTSTWGEDGFGNIGTTGAARVNIYLTDRQEWLFTPTIDLGDGSVDYELAFDLALTDFAAAAPITDDPNGTTGVDDKFAVVISTDNGVTWSAANTMRLWDNAGSPYVYNNILYTGENVVLDLSAYSGLVKFGFYGESTISNADNDLFVDNVVVRTSATTWNGTANNSWSNDANWSNGAPLGGNAVIGVSANNPVLSGAATVNNLTINLGTVLSVTNGGQLTVNGTLTNSAGNGGLVLQSNASGTGSLIHNTADVPATIKRYITGGQYHFASVPLTAAANPTAALFMNSYLWKYDPTVLNWVKYLNEADVLTVTQGYMIWYTGATTTYNFVGNMNNGAFTAATPGGAGTFNLVPNPYPSAINWTAASGWTKTNVANATYIYNNTQYASYVAGVGTNGGTNIIPAGQGFFVQSTGAATLAMNNSVRSHSSQAYFNDPVINDLFRVAVAINGNSDETVVRFTESATASFDSEYDAAKMYGSASAPQLYTMTADNEMLSINSQSMIEGGVSVPLSFEFSADGEITLQFSGVGSFSELQAMFIEDLLTGSMTDLRQHASYTFSHLVNNEPDRFLLHFRDITGLDESGTGWQVWSNNRKVYVNIPELNGQRVSIEMFDVLGSRIFSSDGVLNSPSVVHAMKSGVAIVRVSSADRVYTTKIFIQ